jgi:hypothetical protein
MKRAGAILFLFACACGSGTREQEALRVVATPYPTARASVTVDLADPAPKKPAPSARTEGAAPPGAAADDVTLHVPKVPAVGIGAFTALGSWIDVFDYTNDPRTIVPLVDSMAARGVRTLYLETSRWQSATDIQYAYAVGAALDEAKADGMRVVAWYPPGFDNVTRDVRRSIAAITFRSPKGNHFDAFGADIEYTQGVPDHEERNARAVEYSKKLRAGAGATYPLAAIVIPPSSLESRPDRWPNYPWSAFAPKYNLFMPMNYWTSTGQDARTAQDLTKYNIEKTRALTGKPIHVIGGLAEDVDVEQVAAYVRAADAAGAIGGGLYDFRTTTDELWDELRKLNA